MKQPGKVKNSESASKAINGTCLPFAFAVIFTWVLVALLANAVWAAGKRPLVFCGNANYPPMTSLNNGIPKGLVVDIVRALEKRIGRPIEIRLMVWKEAQALVVQGKADAAVPMSVTEPRKKLFDFSISMYDVRLSIFVRRGKPGISTLSDLHGLRVGATSASLAMQLIQSDPEIKTVALSDNLLTGYQMLQDGKLDAVVGDYWVGHYILAENGIADIQSVGTPVMRMSSAIAVKKGNTTLLGAINAGIKSMNDDGTLANIRTKWEPKEIVIETREQVVHRTYLAVIGALFLVLLAGVVWVVTMRREIARRRNAEAEANENEARFRGLIEYAPEAIVVFDADTKLNLIVNSSAEALFGTSRDELLQGSVTRFYPPEQPDHLDLLKSYEEHVEQALAGRQVRFERAIVSADGRNLICDVSLVRLPSEHKNLLRASYVDITPRKWMEEELHRQAVELEQEIAERQVTQESLEKQTVALEEEIEVRQRIEAELRNRKLELQGILDNSPALIYMKDIEGRYLFVNRRWSDLLHTTSVDVRGKTDLDIFPEEFAFAFMANDREVMQEGETVTYEELCPLQDGMHIFQSFKTPLKDSNGNTYALCGISTDMTEQKKLEEQLHQSQKMESIGRLAGGVAHDFNNMLSVILGAAQLALPKVPKNSELSQLLDAITTAAERSSGITRQLLAFSRQEAIVPKAIDLNVHIAGVQKNFLRLIGENIKFSFHPESDLWTIKMDPTQLDQILMNLSVNARDAMQGGGCLVIETANVRVDEAFSHTHFDSRPGDYVLLSVSDTGCGMDRETLKRIFEPFFTTKAIGEGTGLGLSTVYGIVTQNDGFIRCYSEPGQGTTFSIYLPRLADRGVQEEEIAPAERAGTGTILLVEDEEILIGIAAKLLERLGYTVIPAQSATAAISICEQKDQPIDLILTDVIMPEMNGKEMIDKIKLIRPDINVVFMSGYTADLVAKRGIIEDGMHLIQKPLDLHRLRDALDEVLGAKPATPAESAAVTQDKTVGAAGQQTALPELFTDDSEVTDLFIARAPEYLSQIQSALAEGDGEKVRFFSHKIKGAAAAVGCHALAEIAGELDGTSGHPEASHVDINVDRLNRELGRVLAILKERH